ncbi:hypothetical protein AAL_03782 [Moelleriella libera RCEF 2490]|uniref:Uncharacterized protein n=1 Tax=Moelleriella libera RCEF 2490 TaxID=1081109 RepID=A0A162IPU7_9HYPO|nr:hypothetical protein AAL_03782 [Moelleriella libera RCEF 2490]
MMHAQSALSLCAKHSWRHVQDACLFEIEELILLHRHLEATLRAERKPTFLTPADRLDKTSGFKHSGRDTSPRIRSPPPPTNPPLPKTSVSSRLRLHLSSLCRAAGPATAPSKAHAQDKGQPHQRDEDVRAPAALVVGRPGRGRRQAALSLQRVVHAAQARKVGQQQRPLHDAPDGQVARVARDQRRQHRHGQRQPARLVEEEDGVGVEARPRRHGAHRQLGRREVEVHAVQRNHRVDILEEEGVEGGDDGRRGHDDDWAGDKVRN